MWLCPQTSCRGSIQKIPIWEILRPDVGGFLFTFYHGSLRAPLPMPLNKASFPGRVAIRPLSFPTALQARTAGIHTEIGSLQLFFFSLSTKLMPQATGHSSLFFIPQPQSRLLYIMKEFCCRFFLFYNPTGHVPPLQGPHVSIPKRWVSTAKSWQSGQKKTREVLL